MNRSTSSPFSIGPVQFDVPFVQAALSGYSDGPMRMMARRFGAPYTLAEVMIDRFAIEVSGKGRTEHHLRLEDEDHPVGGQLMGSDPANFPDAAKRLVTAGFDVIDINFGCPVKSAIGGCRGGYHLSQPEVAIEIMQRVRDEVPDTIPVTVKMRRGIDDSAESNENFFRILDAAYNVGAAAVTVHGRTVEQKYVGPSNWGFLRTVKEHIGTQTVLGSGDLFSAQDCMDMMEQTGVDGVTVARGAIGNPWIFAECRALFSGEELPMAPSLFEQRDTMNEHLALNRQWYGDERGFLSFRKLAFKYARLHPDESTVKKAFSQVKTEADWDRVMEEYYSIDAPGQYPSVNEAQQAK